MSTGADRSPGLDLAGLTTVDFAGDRGGAAPFTWGQQAIWKTIVGLAPHDYWLNIRRLLVIRRPLAVATVTAALGRLVERHETLRTRVRPVAGEPGQHVSRAGTLRVEVVEAADGPPTPVWMRDGIERMVTLAPDAAAAAEALVARLGGSGFDYADEWPVRAGLVVVGGRVQLVVLVLSHLAVDWHAAEIVVRDLRVLLARGTLAGDPGPRPLDLARVEAADVRRTERALRYWRTAYQRMPAELLAEVDPAPSGPWFREYLFTSPALPVAAARLAARHGVSTSTVLLAGVLARLGVHTGHRTVGLLTITGNRHQAGYDEIVAPMNQLALIVLDAPPGDPARLGPALPEVWQAALEAYRFGHYDQARFDREFGADGRAEGGWVSPYACFSDVRSEPTPTGAPAGGGDPRALLGTGTAEWRIKESFNWRLFLEVRNSGEALCVSLSADTRFLPPEAIERFARDLEWFLVEAAALDEREGGRP